MGAAPALQPPRNRKTESLATKGPNILPTRLEPPKKVVIEDALWAELQEIADFHTLAFEKMGSKDKAHRPEIVDSFVRWAKDEFWKARGGKPTSVADREKKATEYAAFLKEEQSKQA